MKEAMRRNSISSCFSSLGQREGGGTAGEVGRAECLMPFARPPGVARPPCTSTAPPSRHAPPGGQRELVKVVVGGDGVAQRRKVLLLNQELVHRLVHLRMDELRVARV